MESSSGMFPESKYEKIQYIGVKAHCFIYIYTGAVKRKLKSEITIRKLLKTS